MATRSFISRYNDETEMYESIYCHWDGYPTGVGLTLRDNYHNGVAVGQLMEIGDISSLRDTVVETQQEAYKNRGDTDVDAKIFRFRSEMMEYYRNMSCEYGYIWKDGVWECVSLNPEYINLYELENANV
ncbi:MAG: hypothetical protein FJ211_10710 [Ignavibacteria bacterium]|nr:hypothetical protein [Ignavibacteria bacterium]